MQFIPLTADQIDLFLRTYNQPNLVLFYKKKPSTGRLQVTQNCRNESTFRARLAAAFVMNGGVGRHHRFARCFGFCCPLVGAVRLDTLSEIAEEPLCKETRRGAL